jgi:hypothetical protein
LTLRIPVTRYNRSFNHCFSVFVLWFLGLKS